MLPLKTDGYIKTANAAVQYSRWNEDAKVIYESYHPCSLYPLIPHPAGLTLDVIMMTVIITRLGAYYKNNPTVRRDGQNKVPVTNYSSEPL